MITRDEILKGQQCSPELEANLLDLLFKLNQLRAIWGKPLNVNSGYRSATYNKQIGGAKNSAHLYCQAVDLRDHKGELGEWLLQNQDILEECGLWMESPHKTNTPRGRWIHLQTRPANNRVFQP